MTTHGVSAPPDELAVVESESGQAAFRVLSDTCARMAEQVCLRNEAHLAGLTEAFRARVVVMLGGQALGAYGSYQPEKWQLDAAALDEIHLNVGVFLFARMDAAARAEEVLDTICHELAHLFARVTGVKDTSGRGKRYHNRQFAQIATALGLRVEKSPRSYIGHITTGLSAAGHERYGDLMAELERAFRLLPSDRLARSIVATPSSVVVPFAEAATAEAAASKYVSAQCGCRDERDRPRTIRMARGWWLEATVSCALCQQVFVEYPPARTKMTTAQPNHAR